MTSSRPSAAFFGTPDFAVPCLDALTQIADVQLVLCQPDRPKGRGMELLPPPVKVRALELGLPVAQPTKMRDGTVAQMLLGHRLDIAVVVAYGRILPTDILSAPRLGCVNVHASILPKYRGAAPIQWAVANGDAETGVTLMQMDEGMDTGAMLAVRRTPIGTQETAGELAPRLSALGAELVLHELPKYLHGDLPPTAQDHTQATAARLLNKADAELDFSRSAHALAAHIRGMSPWPGTEVYLAGKRVKVLGASPLDHALGGAVDASEVDPGQVVYADKTGVVIACGDSRARTLLRLDRVQLEGKKPIFAGDWVAGRAVKVGDRLTRASQDG
jgi:methionyl-tRNA formyltransferase